MISVCIPKIQFYRDFDMQFRIGWFFLGRICPFLELKKMQKNPKKNIYYINKCKGWVSFEKKSFFLTSDMFTPLQMFPVSHSLCC